MEKKPLVSIITPCFNSHATIIETIESVKKQSYSHIEHIIIDDGSTLPLEQTIRQYLHTVTLLRQENKGVAAARNQAVKYAQGDILVFLDADDLLDSSYVEKVVFAFSTQNDVSMVACYVSEIGRSKNKIKIQPFNLESFYYHNSLFPSIIAVSKVLFDQVNGYNEKLKVCEDWDIYLRITEINSNVYIIPEYLFFYRKHKDLSSLTDLMGRDKKTVHQAYYQLYKSRCEFYDEILVSPLNVAYLKIKMDKRIKKIFRVTKFLVVLLILLSLYLLQVSSANIFSFLCNISLLLISILILILIVNSEKKLKKFDFNQIPKVNLDEK